MLHIVKNVDGHELREEVALGNVLVDASLASLPQPTRIVVRGGDLTLVLGSQAGKSGLSGQLRLMPALFGRLPLLDEAGEIEGFSTATSAPQAVRLTPAWAIERP